jgi:hypothetical protein
MAAFLASIEMDFVAEYVAAGRVFKGTDTATLVETYSRIWTELLAEPTDTKLIVRGQMAESELRIRQVPLPPLIDERAAVVAAFIELAAEKPALWERTLAGMKREIRRTLHEGGARH